MSLLPVGIGSEEGGYRIERSLRFNSADSAYLSRTFGTPTNQNVWTLSMWIKKTTNGTYGALFARNDEVTLLEFLTNDTFTGYMVGSNIGGTTSVYRDNSAWYHFVFVCSSSTTQTLYINGTQVKTYTATNRFNASGVTHLIGARNGPSEYFNGYMTEIHFVDGQALAATDFGEFNSDTGVWQPKAYTGSYGTNGFYLDFADNSGTTSTTLGADSSGNGNNWTPNNFSVTAGAGNDSLVDSPTRYGTDTGAGGQVRGNYATLNPLASNGTLTNGNLDGTTGSGGSTLSSTIGVKTGKWYFEAVMTAKTSVGAFVGIVRSETLTPSGAMFEDGNFGYGYYSDTGNIYYGSSAANVSYGASWAINDVIGCAFDADAGSLVFYKNGVSQGTYSSVTTGNTYLFGVCEGQGSATATFTVNFGQRPFAYTAPSGFKALCTTNLPEPTIADGGDYFNAVLYTGNGSTQSITGVGFQPDWVWIKSRSTTYNNNVFDSVRGVEKYLLTDSTLAENGGSSGTGSLTAFNSDGFSLGSQAYINNNTTTYVAWNWKANGAGVTNTAGTITSTVSVNTTSGFSIVTYTGNGTAGATVGHGLGVAPSMIIVKRRSGTSIGWRVYHSAIGATKFLEINSTAAEVVSSTEWNDTAPSSTVITLGTNGRVNGSAETYVAYCFAPVAGYSAFGSYVGNGSTDGSFIYTGFRPRWILLKNITTGGGGYDWFLYDSARDTYNVSVKELEPNLSVSEDQYGTSTTGVDLLSNGFKMRTSGAGFNASSNTYIYAAFAENPFKYSLAR